MAVSTGGVGEHCYGWAGPDPPDHRDLLYSSPPGASATPRPRKASLRAFEPPVWDQSRSNSCVPHAALAAFVVELRRQGLPAFDPSRLFTYFAARDLEGTTGQDNGTFIRDVVKALAQFGACPSSLWPFDLDRLFDRPEDACYREALKNQVLQYQSVPQTRDGIEQAIADGFGVIYGFAVCESFESAEVANTGMVPIPEPGESVRGWHGVMLDAYDLDDGLYDGRNSWSKNWGLGGYYRKHISHVLDPNQCNSFWTLRLVEDGSKPEPPPDPNTVLIPYGGDWPEPLDPSKVYRMAPGNWGTMVFTDEGGTPEKPIRIGAQIPGTVKADFEFLGNSCVLWIP